MHELLEDVRNPAFLASFFEQLIGVFLLLSCHAFDLLNGLFRRGLQLVILGDSGEQEGHSEAASGGRGNLFPALFCLVMAVF